MWIRSQDEKRLSDCVEFYLQENKKNRYSVVGCSKNSIGHIIGTYENFEKAKKVLDMIQGCITGNVLQSYEIARDCPLAGIEFNGVFNMPQDNEVES